MHPSGALRPASSGSVGASVGGAGEGGGGGGGAMDYLDSSSISLPEGAHAIATSGGSHTSGTIGSVGGSASVDPTGVAIGVR